MNKFRSAAVSIPDIDGKGNGGAGGEGPGMAINKGNLARSSTDTPNRKNSFFRRVSIIPGEIAIS